MAETDCVTSVLALHTVIQYNPGYPPWPTLANQGTVIKYFKRFACPVPPCPIWDLHSAVHRTAYVHDDEDLSQNKFIPSQNVCFLNKDMFDRCIFIGYRSVYCYLPRREKPAWYAGERLSFNPARNASLAGFGPGRKILSVLSGWPPAPRHSGHILYWAAAWSRPPTPTCAPAPPAQ